MSDARSPVEAIIDVRVIPRAERHRLIFGTFDRLAVGDALVIVNDHDPVPLAGHFDVIYTDAFSWQYLERGPDVWRVRIGRTG